MLDTAPLAEHALLQDPAFATALRLCGQAPLTLPCGLVLLVRRCAGVRVGMLPRASPPLRFGDTLRDMGLARLPVVLSPENDCPLPRCLRLRGPQQLAVIELSGSSSVRRARLHPKWRNQLGQAERAGLRIVKSRLCPDPDTDLLQTETRQSAARGYANWPAPLTAAFARAAPQQTHVFTARLDGRPVAHMLFLSHGRQASYHIGHISPKGKAVCAHNLLLWRAQCWFSEQDFLRLHLGPLDPRTPGLNRFKYRAGAVLQQTGGTHLFWRPFARS